MSKFLRRSVADKSPIYKAIVNEALTLLNKSSSFRKDAVIEMLTFEAISEAVRWDYVRAMLQEQLGGVELVPVAEAYFQGRIEVEGKLTKNTEALRRLLPERFVASGHGKKTAGYVTVIPENQHLVVVVARRKDAQAKGSARAAEKFVKDAVERGCVLPAPTPRVKLTTGSQADA